MMSERKREANKIKRRYVAKSHSLVTKVHCTAYGNKKAGIEHSLQLMDSMICKPNSNYTLYKEKRKLTPGKFINWMKKNSWQYFPGWGLDMDQWRRINLLVNATDSIIRSK